MNFFTLILRNLFRNKRRSLLTLLGIVISFFLFVSIFTLLEAFNSKLKSEAAQVNLFFRPTYMSNFIDGQLPEAFIHKLKNIPFIRYIAPYKIYLGTGRSSEKNVFVLGSYVDQIYHMRNLEGVDPLQMDQMLSERKAALVGIDLMKENEWKLGDEVILKGLRSLPDLPIHIVGVPQGRSDLNGGILVHYDYLKDLMKDGGFLVSYFFVSRRLIKCLG
ncbi:MAG: ABC transporter permease [Deltaproteobacteria bacterium]|nr:ABC transporter permease [Deltaproteobacteria bacterium]